MSLNVRETVAAIYSVWCAYISTLLHLLLWAIFVFYLILRMVLGYFTAISFLYMLRAVYDKS